MKPALHFPLTAFASLAAFTAMAQVPPLPTGPGAAPAKSPPPVTAAGIKAPASTPGLSNQGSSMNPLGETEQMRVQRMIDQRSKMLDTTANIQKKMGATGTTTISNLK